MEQNKLIIKPKFRGEDGCQVISLRIKKEICLQLDNLSAKSGRSRNDLIGTILEYGLKNCIVEK